MKDQQRSISRRRFIQQSARGAGVVAVGSAAVMAATAKARGASAGKEANPFAYDVERLCKTDPKLVHYEQVGRLTCPYPDPHRLAIGPGDHVYLAAGNYISVLDAQGARLNEIALAGGARCVVVTGDGTVYAGLKDHVEVYDAKGRRTASWETLGKRSWLTGLAVGENDVFVADSGNRVVLRYDQSGKLVGRIAEKNKERNVPGLVVPSPYVDVSVGRDGLVRVNNPGRHRVEGYTKDGDLEFFWGKPSAGIEGFCGCCNPIGLAVLTDGRCVTCEKGLPRVKIYSGEGTFECVVAGTEAFADNWMKCNPSDCTTGGLDAAIDSQQRIYILDIVTADVRIMAKKKETAESAAKAGA